MVRLPGWWTTGASVRQRLEMECNKDLHIYNILHYVHYLRNIYRSWTLGLLPNTAAATHVRLPDLAREQISLHYRIRSMLDMCRSFYADVRCLNVSLTSELSRQLCWARYLFVNGKPGTGKSQVIINTALWAKTGLYSSHR